LLAGHAQATPAAAGAWAPELRLAVGQSLLPVFGALLALALVNLAATAWFPGPQPETAAEVPQPAV
jgi:hypothetical protein